MTPQTPALMAVPLPLPFSAPDFCQGILAPSLRTPSMQVPPGALCVPPSGFSRHSTNFLERTCMNRSSLAACGGASSSASPMAQNIWVSSVNWLGTSRPTTVCVFLNSTGCPIASPIAWPKTAPRARPIAPSLFGELGIGCFLLQEVELVAVLAAPHGLVLGPERLRGVRAERLGEPGRPEGELYAAGATPPAGGRLYRHHESCEAHALIIPDSELEVLHLPLEVREELRLPLAEAEHRAVV